MSNAGLILALNEKQLKSLIREAFSLQNVADRAVLDVDALLGRVMLNVRRLISELPEESLLRGRAWRDMQPIVKIEMEPYAQGLRRAIEQQEVVAAPEMAAYAQSEAKAAGAAINQSLGAPTQTSVVAQLDKTRVGKARFRELFMAKEGLITPWTQSMFRVVDRKVRAGMIEGLTTQAIADQVVHETISRGVPGVSLRGQTAVRTIRAQAMAMTRTVTQDVAHQIKEQVWEANADALEGFVYQWSSALDSRTCQTCAPLDNQTWKTRGEVPVSIPAHVNCRCQLLLIDPEDEFWQEDKRTGQQISETPYKYKGKAIDKLNKSEKSAARSKGHYVTKTKVKGDQFYRKAVEFNGTDYSDYLASSNMTTQTEFFGGGRIGERRARYFRSQIDKVNKDPQDILSSMLTGPSNARKFIPLP